MFTYKVASRKNQFGEWKVLCFKDGKRYPDGDAFEATKEDAIATCNALEESERSRFEKLKMGS